MNYLKQIVSFTIVAVLLAPGLASALQTPLSALTDQGVETVFTNPAPAAGSGAAAGLRDDLQLIRQRLNQMWGLINQLYALLRLRQAEEGISAGAMQTNLKANGSDGPVFINPGAAVNLTWSSSGVSSCEGTTNHADDGAWGENLATTGAQTISAVTESTVFKIKCASANGTGSIVDTVVVNVVGQEQAADINPIITSISPNQGPIGTVVTLTGSRFTDGYGDTYVGISESGQHGHTPDSTGSSRVVFTIPDDLSVGQHNISVFLDSRHTPTSNTVRFTVTEEEDSAIDITSGVDGVYDFGDDIVVDFDYDDFASNPTFSIFLYNTETGSMEQDDYVVRVVQPFSPDAELELNQLPYTLHIPAGNPAGPHRIAVCTEVDGDTICDQTSTFTIGTVTPVESVILTVTAPNGGENWVFGTQRTISWTSTNTTGAERIRIHLIDPSGDDRKIIIQDTENDGQYTWTVGQYEGGYISGDQRYQIRICHNDIDTLVDSCDQSDDLFTVTVLVPEVLPDVTPIIATVTVTSPNGGEGWKKGSNKTITWRTAGEIEKVDIKLVNNFGFTTYLIRNMANTGSFYWNVGSFIGGNAFIGRYKIIVCAAGTNTCDQSDNLFNITGFFSEAGNNQNQLAAALQSIQGLLNAISNLLAN